MDKIDFQEKVLGGVFGGIAIIAAIAEMFINGIDAASVVGAIKDVFGTLIVIVLFITFIRQLPKKAKDFKGIFKAKMDKNITKYSPLIEVDSDKEGRYKIASRLDAIYDNNPGAYHTLFDFDYSSEIEFYVSKTVFAGRGASDNEFAELQGRIVSDVSRRIEKGFGVIVSECSKTNSGFKIKFKHSLVTAEEATMAAEIVDNVMLLFIAEYKKK
ncbi:MAG: hypothetical protein MSR67_09815 [Oscillospiraceae bacterium]|nr:hypothetical protein [Oscillospiraceae bacterium]